jgi:hypothetical protein
MKFLRTTAVAAAGQWRGGGRGGAATGRTLSPGACSRPGRNGRGMASASFAPTQFSFFRPSLPRPLREFLADVSSFSNTEGGDVIYGVAEERGLIELQSPYSL